MFPTLQQQLDLCESKLAIQKTSGNLALFKYSRNVMYDQLWQEHPETMECRGHVYDLNTGEIVQAAPRKSFNYLENGWWKGVSLNEDVRIEKKYNGYLACATIHNGERVVTTTGSFDSEYQKFAEQAIRGFKLYEIESSHFEICAEFDPHIVKEEFGAKFLGYRNKKTGHFVPSMTEESNVMKLGEALELVEEVRHEGFMVHHIRGGGICKLKSPYYVGKKKLMRISKSNWTKMRNDPYEYIDRNIPGIWQAIAAQIAFRSGCDFFEADEQARRIILEEMENRYGLY